MENKIQIINGKELDTPQIKNGASADLMTKNFNETFQLKKVSSNIPTYYPKSYYDQIFLYQSGTDKRLYVNIDNVWEYLALSSKVKFTPEGGLAIKMTNKTGGATTKGYLVTASDSVDNAFKYVTKGEPDIIGIVYEASIADGSECWIVVNGIAQVYFQGNATREYLARNMTAAESGDAGQAIAEAVPTSPFATDKHFMEIGHCIEARTGAGLAKVVLHFN